MNTSPSRPSVSRASSVSCGPSTPITRGRKPRQTPNTPLQNVSTNLSKSSVGALRLRTKSKTVKWINSHNNNNLDNTNSSDEPMNHQQQHQVVHELSMVNDQSDNEKTTVTNINSLSLSQSRNNNNNNNNTSKTTLLIVQQ